MFLFGKHRGKPAAGLATVAALFLVLLLGGCYGAAPPPPCHEVAARQAYRIFYGVFTLGLSEALIDDCPTTSEEEREIKQRMLEKAQKGDPQAQYMVSFNVPDPDEKWMWLCRSAMQGYPSAQEDIAVWYDSNIPESSLHRLPLQRPDNVKALVWYTLADSNGYQDYFQRRDRVAASLTPDQVAEAERQVAAWKPDPALCDRATSPDS